MPQESQGWFRMKAKQAFESDEAVSPVVAVVLMVAIMVVLAGIVLILVNGFNKTDATPPSNVSASQDKGAQTLSIVSADLRADWRNILVSFGSPASTCTFSLNGGPPSAAVTVPTTVIPSGQPLKAGDVLKVAGCAPGISVLTLTDSSSNLLLGTWSFTF